MNFRSWPKEFQSIELCGSKREVLIFFFLSLFSPSLSLYGFFFSSQQKICSFFAPTDFLFFLFFFFLSNLILKFLHGPHRSMCPLLIRVPFCPKIIYLILVQVQFILNKLYLSYFLTPEILIKLSSLGVTRRPLPLKIVKKSDCLEIRLKVFR